MKTNMQLLKATAKFKKKKNTMKDAWDFFSSYNSHMC